MSHQISTDMLRRRFLKRILLMALAFGLSFYLSVLLFGNLKSPAVMELTGLDRCPACYGITICPELYSNQIFLDTKNSWTLNVFNAKNIYHGLTKYNRKVVLKKLAHEWELKEFDSKICETFKLKKNCKPVQLMNATNIFEEIVKSVKYNISWPDLEPRKGLVVCPYKDSVNDLLQLVMPKQESLNSTLINIWTMLKINPEPIVLQLIPKWNGWKVPAFGGVCGRLEVVANEGESLSTKMHVEWHRRLKFAKQIIDAALDFTFKHERFRFYLMDWSLDNIVANEKDDITFVDLEDIIVLDKDTSPRKDLLNWYKRSAHEDDGPGFTFSIENICKHHLSDHNLWAACYVLAGDENPLLLPVPSDVNAYRPHFRRLLASCLNSDDRFGTVTSLRQVMVDMLADEKVVGNGTGS